MIPLGIGLAMGLYYRLRSKNVIKIRNKAKQLELEFAAALFQLGNRLGDNLPVEIAVGKVAGVMEGTISGSFFQLVSLNIRRLGMSIDKAIFDPMHGALVSFPSNLRTRPIPKSTAKQRPKKSGKRLTENSMPSFLGSAPEARSRGAARYSKRKTRRSRSLRWNRRRLRSSPAGRPANIRFRVLGRDLSRRS
jgi:hypothetical protein